MKKHIVCFGDSNTHGYCADPTDTADGTDRFNEDERWTCVLQKLLGQDYLVLEEGLSGRTTVFDDPIHGDLAGVDYIRPCLISHEPVDLLIIMLGTNDTKERFGCSAAAIAVGMQRLVRAAQNAECWGKHAPNILVVAPPPIGDELQDAAMGNGCPEKSRGLAQAYAAVGQTLGVHFMDADGCQFNPIDHMHLTRHGHDQLAHRLAELVPTLL
jgi:lysophospholipase L1-like esterase